MLRQIYHRALADFMNNLHDGAAIYKHMSPEVMDQVVVRATQHTIRNRDGSGAGGHGGRAHNTDMHTDNSDDYTGKVLQDVCLGKAIDGHCTDKLCWRKHNAESIEQFKAALGTKRWEKQRQWWNQWKTQQIRGR